MPAAGQHEFNIAAEQLRRLVAGAPRGDVVAGPGQGKDIGGDLLQVDRCAAHFQCIRTNQWIAFEHFNQVAVERSR
ncbi:hypothetical protein D3C80_1036000 [compost metagenome]